MLRDPNERSWEEMFDWFWSTYPKRAGKPKAQKSWRAIKPQNQGTIDAIDQGIERWESYWLKKGTEREFIPYPATFLNQRRWEDMP